jgi:hypothetical protein
MEWERPKHDPETIKWAGRCLIDPASPWKERARALDVTKNNWRRAHAFPMNTLQVNLRKKARLVSPTVLVAQRIKRLRSIEQKLRRFDWFTLFDMQDLGGCRAVLSNIAQVRAVEKHLQNAKFGHKLVDYDDYIGSPKKSGYRSVHLIYAYQGTGDVDWDGLKIEMQLRSRLQHAWATAVETVGLMTGEALKSSAGNQEWQRFFALMGSVIAMQEDATPVPATPSSRSELVRQVRDLAGELDVTARLASFASSLDLTKEPGYSKAHYFLLELEPAIGRLTVTPFTVSERNVAEESYLAAEGRIAKNPGLDVVLVRVSSIKTLQRAYPNYFLDTTAFIAEVERALKEAKAQEGGSAA